MHGKLNCRKCFKSCDSNTLQPHPLWILRNDPGAWGNSVPEVLVLGFSKGSTQADIYRNGSFEDVAFGGPARNRLDQLLKQLGLLQAHEHVSNEISNEESRFAFGSLVRCSLTREGKEGKHASSGDLIVKSFSEVHEVLTNCAEQYLAQLPERTIVVLMLGISDQYISGCFDIMKRLYPSFTRLNDVSYGDDKRVFIHITHPSPLNGHFASWCKGNSKFDQAIATLSERMESKMFNSLDVIDTPKLAADEIIQQPSHPSDVMHSELLGVSNSGRVASLVTDSLYFTRKGRVPVSTVKTHCVPFNHMQHNNHGYEIGENPVKGNGSYLDNFDKALDELRKKNTASWRAHGSGPGNGRGAARKAIGWVTVEDAKRLLNEKDDIRRVQLFQMLTDVVE